MCGGRHRPRRLCVPWGPSFPRKKGTAPTHFLAHVYCGQTARWTKTPLGTKVDLGPGDIVLDGDLAPPPREEGSAASPSFRPICLLWPRSPISATAELSSFIVTSLCVDYVMHSQSLPYDCALQLLLQRAQCAVLATAIPSVCPPVRLSVRLSVCPSHAGIVSKRRHVARCSLHRWIAKCV